MKTILDELTGCDDTVALPIRRLGHVRPLDGLRGIAVSAVFLVHLYSPIFGGGGWGVDLFFVLSGFLITKLLYEEFDRVGRIDVREFYARRLYRLQPAMFVLLLTVTIASLTIFSDVGGAVRKQVVYAALISGNLWAVFEGTADRPLLGHTWSLGLEEQFYLVWPLLLAFLPVVAFDRPRVFMRHVALFTLATVVVGRVVVRGVLDYPHYGSIPVFNIDGLALGCLLAIHLHTTTAGPVRWFRTSLVGLCVAVVTVDLFVGGRIADPYDVRKLVLRAIFAYVVYVVVMRPTWGPVRLLESPVLTFLGRISYSLYLWHIPVFALFDESRFPMAGDIALVTARIVFSFVAAIASLHLVEQPMIRRYRRRRAARTIHNPWPAPVSDVVEGPYVLPTTTPSGRWDVAALRLPPGDVEHADVAVAPAVMDAVDVGVPVRTDRLRERLGVRRRRELVDVHEREA